METREIINPREIAIGLDLHLSKMTFEDVTPPPLLAFLFL